MKTAAIVVIWLACGYGAWGMTLGYFTHRFPDQDHRGTAGLVAASGPFGLFVAVVSGAPYHWRTQPFSTEERWEAFHRSAPELSREYFEQNYN